MSSMNGVRPHTYDPPHRVGSASLERLPHSRTRILSLAARRAESGGLDGAQTQACLKLGLGDASQVQGPALWKR